MDGKVETHSSVLRTVVPENARNQAISQIATQFAYVDRRTRVDALAEALTHAEHIEAVGVVDEEQRVLGLVNRNDFFGLLGRPFGRDVLKNLDVTEVMKEAPTFRDDTNLFTIAEELDDYLKASEISFFPMQDEHDRFRGIFSTHDLLLHLSNMTQNDIALARKLQSRLVRERELVVGSNFEFSAYSASAKGVAGDYYSIQRYTDDEWIISMCDVSGKGVSASIVTSVLWGMMSIYDFRQGIRPLISKLNDYMVRTFEAEKFVTGLFITYDEKQRTLQICDMGHSHIFIYRDHKMLRVATNQNNLPLGVMLDIDPKVSRFVPQQGDILLIVTDGLLEQENAEGGVYSIERVADILEKRAGNPVETINEMMIDDFETFRGNHHLNDDVTYAIMKFVAQEVTL